MTRIRYVIATAAAVLGITIAGSVPTAPRLVWNASASVPIGFYTVAPAERIDLTDLVAVMPPERIAVRPDVYGLMTGPSPAPATAERQRHPYAAPRNPNAAPHRIPRPPRGSDRHVRVPEIIDVVDAATRRGMTSGNRGKKIPGLKQLCDQVFTRSASVPGCIREISGKPDLWVPGYRGADSIHGCFWHGHDCSLFR